MFKAFKLQKPTSEPTFMGHPLSEIKVELLTKLTPPKIPLRLFSNIAKPGLPGRIEFVFPHEMEGIENVAWK